MFKLARFYYKRKYKIVVAMAFLYTFINLLLLKGLKNESDKDIIPALIIFAGFAVFFIIIFLAAGEFRKNLYEDSACLIFLTPQSSYSILGAKLTSAVLELLPFLILTIIFFSISFIFAYPIGSGNLSNIHTPKEFASFLCTKHLPKIVLLMGLIILYSIIALVEAIITTYFSIIISKALIRGKKFAGISAVFIFMLVTFIIYKIEMLFELIPGNPRLDLTPFSLGNANFSVSLTNQSLPIWSEVFCLFFYLGLFLITGYIVDKKLDI
jgi:hypothetical protein